MHEHTELGELAVAVFALNGHLVAWGDRFAARFGLTSARWQVLGALARANTPLTAPMIAQAMGMSRQGVQKQLNQLLDQHLIVGEDNPAHKRSLLYRLTDEGKQVFTAIDREFTQIAGQWHQAFTAAEIRQAMHMLQTWQGLLAHEQYDDLKQ